VDLPRPAVWRRVLETSRSLAGQLHVPVRTAAADNADNAEIADADYASDLAALAEVAGADLTCELAEIAEWLRGTAGPLLLGNYVYAHGSTNVAVSVAVDALTQHLTEVRDDVSLAFLATPTDVFAVPAEAVAHSERVFAARSGTAKVLNRVVSGGRLLRRAYVPGADPGIADSLVPQQGPNYAL
nr:hypothetical protein [Micromonospora sp. DSM 115978]